MYIRQGIIIESLDLNWTQLSYDNWVPSDPIEILGLNRTQLSYDNRVPSDPSKKILKNLKNPPLGGVPEWFFWLESYFFCE
jgi:hypothetical protein